MIVIVCLDDNDGMLFNNRRQSRDCKVTERILELGKNQKLWIAPFSKSLFQEATDVVCDEQFLELAETGDICFVEDESLQGMEDRIEQLIVFRWNRVYPADQYLELDLAAFEKTEILEFEGHSHEKITQEYYVKKGERA